MQRLPNVLAGGLLAAIWAQALIGFGGPGTEDFFARWMHDAIVVAAAAIALVGAFRVPSSRLACGALALGLLATAAGDVLYSLAPDLSAVPVPSVSDPLWLAIFPCSYVALVALTRSRIGATQWSTRLDGIAGGLAIASVLAYFTVSAAVEGSAGAPFWEEATNLAYPVGDLVLLGSIVSAVGLAGWRIDRVWALLGAAVLAQEAADLIYMTGVEGQLAAIADALMGTAMTGLALAATLARPARRPATADRGPFIPVAAGALALGVLAVGVTLHVNAVSLGLAVAALAVVLARMALAVSENHVLLSASRVEAATDALTGLGNRRRLKLDLEAVLAQQQPHALVLLDLNGFKTYNDHFGHGAGDMLLARLSAALTDAVEGRGTAYRMGGDEFCVLARADADLGAFSALCAEALRSGGDGFAITAAHGAVLLPDEGREASAVLALADARMYRHKHAGRRPAAHQSADVLLAVVAERAPGLASHAKSVCALACAAAEELGMSGTELDALRHAAALHDIGKMAIPQTILDKPGPLSDAEWALIHSHTLVGERILAAAPDLERSARLVRSSHERYDGTGYPDRLVADEIPLGSRIILVADAFDAMVSERSYGVKLPESAALAELRRCAGTQFDPAAVAAFERAAAHRDAAAVAS